MKPLAVALAFAFAAAATQARAADPHIAKIENGLAPSVVLTGRPAPSPSLVQRMQDTRTPGVSIAFFENGKIAWTKTYGVADAASGRPVTADTLFQAASISKSVTAVGALALVQANALDLDQDVNTRLTGWKLPDSPFTATRKVTLRELLSHTAGVTVHGFSGYAVDAALPTTVQILNGAPPANSAPVVSDAAPGAHWSYSGGGYVVAQLMMTEATGQTFPALMQRLVLGPAGMTRSSFAPPPQPDPALASGYLQDGAPVPGGHHVYPEMAPAGLWTTPSDLARFAIAVQDAANDAPHAILSPALAKAMMTPTLNNWGLGVGLSAPGKPPHFEHSGDNDGFHAMLFAYTGGRRQGVAIMTNGDGGTKLIPEIMRAVATAYGWPVEAQQVIQLATVSQATLASYAGEYDIPGIAKVTVSAEGDRLYAFAPALSPERYELLPKSETAFFILENGATVTFARGPAGAVTGLDLVSPLGPLHAVRK